MQRKVHFDPKSGIVNGDRAAVGGGKHGVGQMGGASEGNFDGGSFDSLVWVVQGVERGFAVG